MYFMFLLIVICVVRRPWAPVEGRHSKIYDDDDDDYDW